MSAITYKPNDDGSRIAVRLEGRTVGHILKQALALSPWAYAPVGSKTREVYATLAECKRALEAE